MYILGNEEIWKDVVITQHSKRKYFVSDYGRCKSVGSTGERILKGGKINGTITIDYCVGYKKNRFTLNREVAKAFLPQPENPELYQVMLINTFRTPNAANLKWVLLKDFGVSKKNNLKKDNRGNTKIEKRIADCIRRERGRGVKQNRLARKYGISATQIKRIERNENWKVI